MMYGFLVLEFFFFGVVVCLGGFEGSWIVIGVGWEGGYVVVGIYCFVFLLLVLINSVMIVVKVMLGLIGFWYLYVKLVDIIGEVFIFYYE